MLLSNLQLTNFKVDETSVVVIIKFSLGTNSSVSLVNQEILVAGGLDTNLQLNSASWPSLMFTFSNFAFNLGRSFYFEKLYKMK